MKPILLIILGLWAVGAWAQSSAEQAILDLDAQMLQALSDKDTTTLRSMVLPETDLVAIAPNKKANTFSVSAWLNNIASSDSDLKEVSWDQAVQVSGPIASLWAPYEFTVDGEFHHCGINVVNFVETEEGWKVAKIVFSVQREDCPGADTKK